MSPPEPRRCAHCGLAVVPDEVTPGRYRHLDRYGWLCPPPYLTLAEPAATPAPPVATPEPAAASPEPAATTPESAATSPRRTPTPIPPRKETAADAPDWPPASPKWPWW